MQGSANLNLKTRGTPMSETPIIQLRGCMIEGMSLRKTGENTLNHYIRRVKTFSTVLARSCNAHAATKLWREITSPVDLLKPLRPNTDPPK